MRLGSRSFIPVLLSFITLSIGLVALLSPNVYLAAVLIIAGVLVQRLGKFLAVRLYAEFDIVKELFSMSDLICFGILPVNLAWKVGLSNNTGILVYLTIIFFVISAVYHLSRYNLSSKSDGNRGLPISFCAVCIAVSIFFTPSATFLSILLVVLSLLMLSRIKLQS